MPDARSGKSHSNRLIDYLKLGQDYLEKKGIDEARLKTERMLCHLLNMDRVALYLNFDRPLSKNEVDLLRDFLKRVSSGEPLQYVTGMAGFYNSEFIVRPGVLIPRPETELIIELALKEKPEDGFFSAIDIGCGSGCLSITLLEEGITANLTAVDVSLDALYVTYLNSTKHGYSLPAGATSPKNAAEFQKVIEAGKNFLTLEKKNEGVGKRLTLCLMNAFEQPAIPPGHPFDLVVSNPPYISKPEYDKLPDHIRKHEPEMALRSGNDGLDAHRSLASSLQNWLDNGGLFLGEIGAMQKEAVEGIYGEHFPDIQVISDLNHLPRVVRLCKI